MSRFMTVPSTHGLADAIAGARAVVGPRNEHNGSHFHGTIVRLWKLTGDTQSLVEVFAVEDVEAAHEFLCLGIGSVSRERIPVVDANGLRAGPVSDGFGPAVGVALTGPRTEGVMGADDSAQAFRGWRVGVVVVEHEHVEHDVPPWAGAGPLPRSI